MRRYPSRNMSSVVALMCQPHDDPLRHKKSRLSMRELFCSTEHSSAESLHTPQVSVIALFPVGYPNVFYLNCVLQEPPAFRLIAVEPVDKPAFIRKDLLQISDREQLHLGCASLIAE